MPIKKLQTLPKALLQALKDYYNKYFGGYNYRNACINRRGYWQMLAIVAPCHILVLYAPRYLGRNMVLPHDYGFLSYILALITWPYFIPWFFLAFFYIVFFIVIASHRCRDIGISHWYTLLVIFPYIKIAFIIIFGCLKKDSAEKYGLRKNKKTSL